MAVSNSSNSSLFPVNSPCLFDKRVFDQYCLIPAVIIIIILAFLNKRVRIKPKTCDGRPGLVLPINFLGDNTNNRLSIAVAFGVIAGNCFQLFNSITGFIPSSLSVVEFSGHGSWDKALDLVVWVLLYGVINFPIFACLMTDHLLVGAVFGFLYTLMKFIAVMVLLFSCPSPYIQRIQQIKLNPVFKHSQLFQLLPDLLCYLFLLGRFAVLLIKELFRKYRRSGMRNIQEPMPVIAKAHDFVYVRLLLSDKLDQRLDPSRNWCIKLRDWFYKPRKDFKFSTEMVATVTVSVIFIYQMTVSMIVGGAILTELARKALARLKNNKLAYEIYSPLFVLVDILGVSADVSGCFSAYFTVLILLHFLKCHRKHVLHLYKAKRLHGNSPSRLVGRSLSYPGYQIAYIGCGYIVLTMILLIISIFLGVITKAHKWDYLLHAFVHYGLPIIVVPLCVWIFQYLLGWLVFRDRRFPDKAVNINNHRLYCVLSFFFFFFNILVGFVSSILRLLKSMILGVIFLSRIDRTPLMLGYHKWDQGYMSYIGFLNVLKSYSHPVMLVFCQFLVDQRQTRSRHPLGNDDQQFHRVSQTAFNRWLVAYTLIKNPDLRESRKRNLRASFLNTDAAGVANTDDMSA